MKNNFRNVRVFAKKYLRIFVGGFGGGGAGSLGEVTRDEYNTTSDAKARNIAGKGSKR